MIIATNMSTIPQLFGGGMPQSDSDNVVLAPPNINPRSAPSLQPDEFKLYGKVYVRCCSLAQHPKATRKWQSIIWKYGEDIQLRTNSTKVTKRYWYCISVRKSGVNRSFPSSIQVIPLALIILSRNTILTLKLASISLLKTAPRQ